MTAEHTLASQLGSLKLERDLSQSSTTSESELESPAYLFCNNATRLEQLNEALTGLTTTPNPWQKPYIFLNCEGRDLGRVGGRLALLGIGIKDEIYLLDILTYSRNLDAVKSILEDSGVEKIVWDGRDMFSELWHGHEIQLQGVLDLQLLHVYENTSRRSARGFHEVEDIRTAYDGCEEKGKEKSHVDLLRMLRLQDQIHLKEEDDKDFWLRRPFRIASLDYASFRILQLHTLYTFYVDRLTHYPHLYEESKRYIELYITDRPPVQSLFLNHMLLPQEILERGSEVKEQFDIMGTRTCAGCRRLLHQDSFRDSFARPWKMRLGEHGRMCYTCSEAQRLRAEHPPHRSRLRVERVEEPETEGVE